MIAAAVFVATLLFLFSLSSSVNFFSRMSARRRASDILSEIVRGAHSSFSTDKVRYPSEISALLAELQRELRISDMPRRALCWELGHAIGEICRKNGYQDGLSEGIVPHGVIRLEMPLEELLHVSWLAHLGFQHMMPNYRGIETHRFDGAHDAREGARSVGVLECAIPKKERPFDDLRTRVSSREKMIRDWWIEKPATLHVA